VGREKKKEELKEGRRERGREKTSADENKEGGQKEETCERKWKNKNGEVALTQLDLSFDRQHDVQRLQIAMNQVVGV
jgi:hypothetical protein